MIQAFVGLVGGGKSFCSTRRMLSYMALGGRCCSNIRLTGWDEKSKDLTSDSPCISYLRQIGWEYQPKQYVYISFDDMVTDPLWFKRIPSGFDRDHRTLCVIDEATDLFDTLDGGKLRNDSGYRELFHFLRLSRHAHIDVLFVCQDINSINSRLRGLVANVWRSTDMRNFKVGIFKFGFPFDIFMLQLYDRTGKYLIKRDFVRKDPRIFSCYESETFGGALGVKWDGVAVSRSKGRITRKEEWSKKMVWKFLVVLSAVSSLVAVWFCYGNSQRGDYLTTNDVNRLTLNCFTLVTNTLPMMIRNSKIVLPFSSNTLSSAVGVAGRSIAPCNPSDSLAPKKQVLRGEYNFHQCGNLKWVEFEGDDYRVGVPCEFGRVVLVDEFFVLCVDDDGNQTVLRSGINEYEKARKRGTFAPPRVSFQAGAGHTSAREPLNNLVSQR